MSKITHKNVLITGANRGIGRALLESFLAAGSAKVYAAVRNPSSVHPLVERYGDRVVPLQLDLSDEASVQAAAMKANDVDIVINNGGVLRIGGVLDASVFENIDLEFDVNVKGLLRMAQAFAPVLGDNGGGVFAQLNSIASLKGFEPFSSYAASKAAAYNFTQSIRDALSEQGTQVISVHPGPIATDMGSDAGFDDVAEPSSVVADALIAAIENGDFHVFPDSMAKQFGAGYASFAENFIEADFAEA